MEKEKDEIIVIVDEPASGESDIHKREESKSPAPPKKKAKPPKSAAVHPAKYIKAIYNKGRGFLKSLPKDLSPAFVKFSCAVSAAILVLAAAFALFIPKSDGAVQNALERQKKTDSSYISAAADYEREKHLNDELSEQLEQKKQDLREFRDASGNLDKISESNTNLEADRDKLQNEIDSKENSVSQGNDSSARTVTLSSGSYTVGTDITAGKYTVTGIGSIAIADSGRSVANKSLSSTGEQFELKQGYRIQIDGNAKFIPN